MEHTTYRGKVLYIGDKVGERGREQFTVTKHRNGHRTLRAMSEIYDSQVLRDVTLTVNERFQTEDAFIRLTVDEQFMGSGWFRFTDSLAECETFMAEGGRVSQRIETTHRPPFFGAHPVVNDCWCCAAYDRKSSEKIQLLQGGMMSSLLANGASGPMLHRMDLAVEYIGPETITVPAGTFDTDHYRFHVKGMDVEDLWCWGEDFVLVQIRWDLLQTTYQLVEFERDKPQMNTDEHS